MIVGTLVTLKSTKFRKTQGVFFENLAPAAFLGFRRVLFMIDRGINSKIFYIKGDRSRPLTDGAVAVETCD